MTRHRGPASPSPSASAEPATFTERDRGEEVARTEPTPFVLGWELPAYPPLVFLLATLENKVVFLIG
jgi:hypothetical protein